MGRPIASRFVRTAPAARAGVCGIEGNDFERDAIERGKEPLLATSGHSDGSWGVRSFPFRVVPLEDEANSEACCDRIQEPVLLQEAWILVAPWEVAMA